MWTLGSNIFSKPQPWYYNQILPLDIIVSCYRANQSVAKWWENYWPENPKFCQDFLTTQQPTLLSPRNIVKSIPACFNNLLYLILFWRRFKCWNFIVLFISYRLICLTRPESKELPWHRPQSDNWETLNKINKTLFWPDSAIAFLPGPFLVNYGWTEDL